MSYTLQSPGTLAASQITGSTTDLNTALATIDTKSARPLRAISAGTATQVDRDYLASLEQEAATLRAQL